MAFSEPKSPGPALALGARAATLVADDGPLLVCGVLETRAAAGGHQRQRQQERRGRADHDPARTVPQRIAHLQLQGQQPGKRMHDVYHIREHRLSTLGTIDAPR